MVDTAVIYELKFSPRMGAQDESELGGNYSVTTPVFFCNKPYIIYISDRKSGVCVRMMYVCMLLYLVY